METQFALSPDGTRVAYERHGSGPAIVLLHGGGGSRQEWHDAGYVDRLRDEYTVILIDLRGHGESGLPTEPADYTTEKMGQDILAVADASGLEKFNLWGMSFGGQVGRYLAVQSERVAKLVLMGTPLGAGVSGERRKEALDFCAYWSLIQQSQKEGILDPGALSPKDQEFLKDFNVPAMLGWVGAMLDWPVVKPGDFHCPTLWLVGSEDPHAMASLKEYEQELRRSRVQVKILGGLTHEQVFDEIERVMPILLAFSKA